MYAQNGKKKGAAIEKKMALANKKLSKNTTIY